MGGPLHIRTITAADAEPVVRMWSDFARYLRELGDTDEQNFGVEPFLRDGFGPDPAFSGIIAERDGGAVGYLLYHFGYDSDQAMRVVYIVDLWVDPAARRGGVGRALMGRRPPAAGPREAAPSSGPSSPLTSSPPPSTRASAPASTKR